uniref:Lamin n=1 Tax=Acrobeloides nanus TaxID=290746 RepID=A0A914C742_9BILA
MSTKQKRSSRIVRETVHVDTSSADETYDSRSHSPGNTSGTRWTRQQEKEQLSGLNDRLATYIEKVRNLETENARLHVQIRDVEVIERKEKDNLASRYETKINDLRNLIDSISRDKAKLEIERSKAVDGYEDLKGRVSKLEKDLRKSEEERQSALSLVNDYQARVSTAESRRQNLENQNTALKRDVDDLQKQLDVLRRQLEDEVMLRTELENKLKTYKEDLEFARLNHNTQMEEFRRKRQVEMTSVSNEIENRYQAKLQEQLQAMRGDFDARIAQNRREVDDMYKNKLNEAQDTANRHRAAATEAREELSRYRIRIHELETASAAHDAKVDSLNRRISELEALLRRTRDEAEFKIQQRDERIAELEREIDNMISEYRDLMDLKIQLDTELQAYQKLLEGEETRLRITPSNTPNVSQQNISTHHVSFSDSPSRRGVKRKRLEQDDIVNFDRSARSFKTNSNSDVDVVIDDVDTEGRYIRLINKGDEEFPVGAWCIKSTAGEREIMFKFHTRQNIKPGKSITIWSADSGESHAPPTNIVMKNQSWPTGDAIRAELLNEEKTVVAWRETLLESGFYRIENGQAVEDRCLIM